MKAFTALVNREFIEHKGAFFIGPLLLLAVLFGITILAFTVGRVDVHMSGALLTKPGEERLLDSVNGAEVSIEIKTR